MSDPIVIYLFLFAAGLMGGAVNSLAGGGSFITFPALIFAGIPPVVANATNTFAAMPGYAAGALGFIEDIRRQKARLPLCVAVGAIGGWLGAELLLLTSNQSFAVLVPWLMLVAVLAFAYGGRINRLIARQRPDSPNRRNLIGWPALILTAVCIYGGFFNAGLGILLLAFLALDGLTDIHEMNGLKLIISTMVALVATTRLGLSGAIAWTEGGVTLAGIVIGGYGAARITHLIAQNLLRTGILIYGAFLTILFFYQVYLA